MITEDYVSFKVAKLLKEKGFDEKCSYEWGVPDIDGGYILQKWSIYNGEIRNSELINDAYAAPTLQMACKWLREVHKTHIVISPISSKGYGAILCDVGDFNDFNYIAETDYFFHPEEAIEAAIKYTLENLI